MASLYEISDQITRIFDEVESNDGEITDSMYEELAIRKEELKDKLESYVKAVKEFKNDAEFCKNEKKAITDRQNVYKNRVDRLMKAMLDAVVAFGERGKTNNFVELRNCRLFTRSCKSVVVDDFRARVLIAVFGRKVLQIVKNDVLYTGEDVDLQPILDDINETVKSEYRSDFQPFNMADLESLKVDISCIVSIADLFKYHRGLLTEIGEHYYEVELCDGTPKEYWKAKLDTSDGELPTLASIVTSDSLIIK